MALTRKPASFRFFNSRVFSFISSSREHGARSSSESTRNLSHSQGDVQLSVAFLYRQRQAEKGIDKTGAPSRRLEYAYSLRVCSHGLHCAEETEQTEQTECAVLPSDSFTFFVVFRIVLPRTSWLFLSVLATQADKGRQTRQVSFLTPVCRKLP